MRLLLIILLAVPWVVAAPVQQCRPQSPPAVFYNRVPKAASTSLKTLAGMRAKALDYLYVSSRVYNDRGKDCPGRRSKIRVKGSAARPTGACTLCSACSAAVARRKSAVTSFN